MKTLRIALFAAVGFATLVGALVLSVLQPQESEGQPPGLDAPVIVVNDAANPVPTRVQRTPTVKKCCYYERANRQGYTICTIDPQCPDITGNLIGSWGVEKCNDCKKPGGGTLPIGNRYIPKKT